MLHVAVLQDEQGGGRGRGSLGLKKLSGEVRGGGSAIYLVL